MFSLGPCHNPWTLSFCWLLQHCWADLLRAESQWVTSWVLGQTAVPRADACPKTKGSLSNARLHTAVFIWVIYVFTNMKPKCFGLSENTDRTGSQRPLFINAWNVIAFVKKPLSEIHLAFLCFSFYYVIHGPIQEFKKKKKPVNTWFNFIYFLLERENIQRRLVVLFWHFFLNLSQAVLLCLPIFLALSICIDIQKMYYLI